MTRSDGYLLDNGQSEAGRRFAALATLFDPGTFRHLENLGVAPGGRCWEVGAGGTSVISWLAERVGPAGRVLATDIDTSWATAAARPRSRCAPTTWAPGNRPASDSIWCTPGSCWCTCRTGTEPCAR